MISASRLCRAAYASFDGSGGLFRAGRWHDQGLRVVYAAESEALAALEALVHLSSPTQIPEYVCIKAAIPSHLIANVEDLASLPSDWSSDQPREARQIGSRWLKNKMSAVLRVPSVVIPRESNYMFNPNHPDFEAISIGLPLPFTFDTRLIGRVN